MTHGANGSVHNPDQEPGVSLRAAREAEGMTLQQVAEQLNLLVSHVEALENNDFSCFNAELFARGYVRSYARLFALNDTALLQATNARLKEKANPPKPMPKRGGPKPHVKVLLALGGAILLWLLAVLLSEHGDDTTVHVEPLPGLVDPLPFEVVTPLGAELLQRANGEFGDTEDEPALAPAHPVLLEMDMRSDVWMEVRNNAGDILLSGLHEQGQHLELSAVAPLELIISYWPGVELHFNGVAIDLSEYSKGNAVRVRLFE